MFNKTKRIMRRAIIDQIEKNDMIIDLLEHYATGCDPEKFNDTIAGAKLKIRRELREYLQNLLQEVE